MNLVFDIPGAEAPGYLRRMRRAAAFAEQFSKGQLNPALIDDLVAFLAEFVSVPDSREAAIEALYEASQEQFNQLLGAVMGAGGSAVPPASGGNSESD